MKTRSLRTGIPISEIGLGCWGIGGPFHDGKGWMGYGDADDAESLRCLRRAAELGVTFYDTASVYGCGHSEELIGAAFEGRADIVISTKFGFTFDAASRKVTGTAATPGAIRSSLEGSLNRLRRECVDLFSFQLWDHPLEQAGEVLSTLDALVAEGKIRSYCWLTDDPERVRFFAKGAHCAGIAPPVVVIRGRHVVDLAPLTGTDAVVAAVGAELDTGEPVIIVIEAEGGR